MAATVTLREEFDTGGCTVSELVSFGARAAALGLQGYNVRVATAGRNDNQSVTLGGDPSALRNIRALEVTGPAPDMR